MTRFEALVKRIVDAINAEHGATFVGEYHQEGSYSVAVTIANALADDHQGAVDALERIATLGRTDGPAAPLLVQAGDIAERALALRRDAD